LPEIRTNKYWMRINEILFEAVTDNYLYHSTTARGLKGMLKNGKILPSTAELAHGSGGGGIGDHGSISLSRDRHYFPFDETDIQIVLDRTALAQNFRIKPYNFAGRYESEERIDSPIPFNSRYVKGIVFRNDAPSRAVAAALKKLGIAVQDYRPLPAANIRSKVDFSVDPADYGDEKLDWKIADIENPNSRWKTLRNSTADAAVAWFNDFDKKYGYSGRFRLMVD
jgi:hypothetical protein